MSLPLLLTMQRPGLSSVVRLGGGGALVEQCLQLLPAARPPAPALVCSYHPHSMLCKHLSWEVARTPRKRSAGGSVQLPSLSPHTHRAGVCSVCPGFGDFSLTGWGTYTGQAPWYCLPKEGYGKEDGATRMMAKERGTHRSWKPSSEGSGVTGTRNACER